VRDGIGEAHRAEEILEAHFAQQGRRIGGELPVLVQAQQHFLGGGARQRLHAAFARHAAALREASGLEGAHGAARRG
jgi:hypothetical protein